MTADILPLRRADCRENTAPGSASPRAAVLYATYVSPFPSHSGERIRAVNLIAGLIAAGYDVEAVVGNYDDVDLTDHNRTHVRYHPIPFAWPRLRQAADIYFKPHPDFIEQVARLHQERRFAAILLDYGFMGAQIDRLSRLGVPILLGTHNLESAVTAQVPRKSFSDRLALGTRHLLERAHERRFFRRADGVLCVSQEDRDLYAEFIDSSRLHVVPNFVDIPDLYRDAPRQNRIIMTGSFGNYQNRQGLDWFVRHVWDESLQRLARFVVAGRDSDTVARDYADVPGFSALGPRSDLVGEIAHSRLAIVPIWNGGGTRLKCLEAMAARTPVVSTGKGCEGIRHDGAVRVADDPAAFRAAMAALLEHPESAALQADKARDAFDRNYSLAANASRLNEAIQKAGNEAARRRRVGAPAAPAS